mmetsp:Transcript_2284/g.4809  ORF Transcript_2284/g.4809 Transcript_2284/m.4809 type:complete len:244 (-) Transcript_2284:125-856(-)
MIQNLRERMIRVISVLLVISRASGDEGMISLDELEEAKAARLIKNRGDEMDVQSTFHEVDIKDTGGIPDELSARLVKNRGPITAKIIASGSHSRYCKEESEQPVECGAQFSLIAWKFAGDEGTVHGMMEETFDDGDLLKVDVDCMVRRENDAIVGGVVTQIHKWGKQELLNSRAYVKVADGSNENKVDRISDLTFGWDLDSNCKSHNFDEFMKFDLFGMAHPRVSVCSKHGDWEGCLEKAKME